MAKEKKVRPAFATEAHLVFLDDLRESGETNMYGARPYLMREFPALSREQAIQVVVYWMDSFPRKAAA
jgi:hypothetical protein